MKEVTTDFIKNFLDIVEDVELDDWRKLNMRDDLKALCQLLKQFGYCEKENETNFNC